MFLYMVTIPCNNKNDGAGRPDVTSVSETLSDGNNARVEESVERV